MHPYEGQDPYSWDISDYILGKGYWPAVDVPDDDNDRDAANFGIGLEGLTDRTVWLAWRMVNGLESNTALTPYIANIWWSGNHTYSGTVTLTTLAGNITAAGNWTFSGLHSVTGLATFTNNVTLQKNLIHSGNDAFRVLRKTTAANATPTTIDAWKMDVLEVPDLTGDTIYTLAHPPSDEVIELTVYWPEQTLQKRLELKDGSRSLCVIWGYTTGRARDGSVAKVILSYMGSGSTGGWRVKSIDRGKNIFYGPNGNVTIDLWEYDLVIVPDLGASRTYTVAEPPAGYPPFETEIRWPTQGTNYVLTIQTVGGASTLEAVTAGDDTSSGVATLVIANDGQGSGTNGVNSYYVKTSRGPYP